MRKIIIMVLVMVLVGCSWRSSEQIYRDIYPAYKGYATHLSIEENRHFVDSLPEKDFQVRIIEIRYTPLTQTVFVKYDIYDGSYQGATYLTVGRKGESLNGDDKRLHRLTANKGEFEEYFYGIDLSQPFHVLFGKYDRDDLNPTILINAVKSITIQNKLNEARYEVRVDDYLFEEPTDFTSAHPPYIEFDYAFEDPDQAIQRVKFVLVEEATQREIATVEKSNTSSHRKNDRLAFSDIRFDNVAPSVNYHVLVVVSGHDHIDAFKDVVFQVFRVTTEHYANNSHDGTYHGFYGAITDVRVDGDEVVINYMIHNDFTVKNSSLVTPKITLSIHDNNNEEMNYRKLYEDVDVTENEGEIRLPLSEFSWGATISLYVPDLNITLARYGISSKRIPVGTSLYGRNQIGLIIMNDAIPTTEMQVELLDSNGSVLEQFVITPFKGVNLIDVVTDVIVTPNLQVRITYEVETQLGPMVHTKTSPLYFPS